MTTNDIPARVFVKFPYKQQGWSEFFAEGCLFVGRKAFGFTQVQEDKSLQKISYSVLWIFIALLAVPLILPLSIVGFIMLLCSKTHQEKYHDLKAPATSPQVDILPKPTGTLRQNLKPSTQQAEKYPFLEEAQLPANREWKVAWQHHEFHDKLVGISDRLQTSDEKTKKVWKRHLEKLNGLSMTNPDGYEPKIDTRLAQARLDGDKPEIKIVELNSPSREDFKKIAEIERESFETSTLAPVNSAQDFKISTLVSLLMNRKDHRFIVAKANQEIVGVLEYCPSASDKNAFYIYSVCRKAAFGGLSIGKKMLQKFKERACAEEKPRAFLHVRKTNPAKQLYQKFEFVYHENKPNFYNFPREDAVYMKADWT